MKEHLSDRVNQMAISATLAMAAKARELKSEGKQIIGLSLGEPDFSIPQFIKDAAIDAVKEGYNSYSPVDGYLDLKEAICTKFKRDNNIHYSPNQIVVSTGAKQCLANVALALINEGDEVILPTPYWVSYSEIVKLAGGVPVDVKTSIEDDFKMTPEQLKNAITSKTKMIWYSSPCNPSGSVYSRAELEGIAEVIKKHDNIYVLSDEIYEYINFSGKHTSIATIEEMYERTITVNGVSKAFAMTGWRVGYLGAPEWIAKACNKIQGQTTSGTNSIAQRATITAVSADPKEIDYMVKEFHQRRDLLLKMLGEIEGFKLNIPEGAFYVFPNISAFFGKTIKGKTINNSNDFSMLLLEHANVATVAGDSFGDNECIRISYAASEKELIQAVENIKKALH